MRRSLLPAAALILTAPYAPGLVAQDPDQSPGQSQEQDQPLGKSAAFGVLEAGPTIAVPAGTALRSRPDAEAERLLTIATETEVQILERRGDWVRTAYEDWSGWVAPLGEESSALPLPHDLRAPWLSVEIGSEEKAAKLAGAHRLLGPKNDAFTRVGRWPLYTDVEDTELLELLDRVARQVPVLYAQRTGLDPVRPASAPPVVLFAREADYRAFAQDHTEVGELEGGGHADGSMAALFVDRDSTGPGVAAILVHELTHLLNRETFVRAPATWLEEGLANDLGFTKIDPKGKFRLGELGGTSTTMTQRTSASRVFYSGIQTGGRAMWGQLLRDWRSQRSRLTPLTQLLDMPWVLFVDPNHRSSNYAMTAMFVHYLFNEAEPDRQLAFRGFLAEAARGADTGSAALARALDTTPGELERSFERWLTFQAVARR